MSEAAQLCPIFCNPMDCSLPGFSVRGIFQARILEWVAILNIYFHLFNLAAPGLGCSMWDLLDLRSLLQHVGSFTVACGI